MRKHTQNTDKEMATHTVYFRSSLKVSTQTHMYTVHHIPNIFLNQDGKIDLLTFFLSSATPFSRQPLSMKEINVFCNVTL